MLPLIDPDLPTNTAELVASLTNGLGKMFTELPTANLLTVEGDRYPILDRLAIDVSGAAMQSDYRPRSASENHQPGITVEEFEVVGRPVHYETSAITLEISGREVQFEVDIDPEAGNILVPVDAREGRVTARADHADLEALVQLALQAGADEYELTIEKVELTMTREDERTVLLQMRITGKKQMFVPIRAVLLSEGRLVIDETLTATFQGLTINGEGVIGSMVAGLVRGKVEEYNGKSYPLTTTFSLGQLKLHDLKVDCENGLAIEALLGRDPAEETPQTTEASPPQEESPPPTE
jgi:hypothetical protein